MAGNSTLGAAKAAKNDEFYTLLSDVEKEMRYYKKFFRGKVVYCNCDTRDSNFFKYFAMAFEHLGLKKLIATGYNPEGKGTYFSYEGDTNGNLIPDDEEIEFKELEGNGDFRSPECKALLAEADIVVTNPPFSLFREFVMQLVENGKDFLIIGPENALKTKDLFPLIKGDLVWLGNNNVKSFITPSGETQDFGNICWYTNLSHKRRSEPMDLYRKYTPEMFPKYDFYDAIEVSKCSEIPMDYDGLMAVPITFLKYYDPEQFEIIDLLNRYTVLDALGTNEWAVNNHIHLCTLNGQIKFSRIIIRRK